MNYRINERNGDRLSVLGFGCMRYPSSPVGIDIKATEALLIRAIELGVNYFDTAYFYHAGKSESILGDILTNNNLRDSVYVATKLPPFIVGKASDIDKIFETQLKRLKTDHIDYYLLHMLTDLATFDRLRSLGFEQWVSDKKKNGAIKNIGFSYHGGKSEFVKIIDAYDWDICQIQYNYYDENNQAGKSGLRYAASKGIPIVIMEPLRGGRLVNNLPANAKSLFTDADPERSLADWGLSWVWNHVEATVTLSGMSTLEQLEENIGVADKATPGFLTVSELEAYKRVKSILGEMIKINCTGCGYCMPCPSGVDIPICFSYYNDIFINGKGAATRGYLQNSNILSKKPSIASVCTKCGKCEALCPQGIEIRDNLEKTKKALEPFILKPVLALAKLFLRV